MSEQGEVGIQRAKSCSILSLDGGGAKGFYTLGVLRELEAQLGGPLCSHFDLVYGTSTGSIIAALLALGNEVETIHQLYREHVPLVMKAKSASSKSMALQSLSDLVFEDQRFDQVKTGLGVVTTRWRNETPMIFKSDVFFAHGRKATFEPGFGCMIGDAVQASCSAVPFFNRKTIITSKGDEVELIDGGYCANNPTLYALADATNALNFRPEDCRVLSLGCGSYPEPNPGLKMYLAKRYLVSVELLQKTLSVNTESMDQLRQILFTQVPTVRISDTFDKPEMATDLFEHNLSKLNILRQCGAESFAAREAEIKTLFRGEI